MHLYEYKPEGRKQDFFAQDVLNKSNFFRNKAKYATNPYLQHIGHSYVLCCISEAWIFPNGIIQYIVNNITDLRLLYLVMPLIFFAINYLT